MAKDKRKSIQQQLKELRAKLDAIDRRSAVGKLEFSTREIDKQKSPIVYYRRLPRRDLSPRPPEVNLNRGREGLKLSLEEVVAGIEIRSRHGEAFMVSTCVDDLEDATFFSERFSEKMTARDSGLWQRIAAIHDPEKLALHDVLFMDIETTGLGNSPLFLIGIMFWEMAGFEVRQFLARDYAEEATVISCFIEACASKKLLITFNGKSFDMPYIRARAAVNRIPFQTTLGHFDLLHECRRIWRDVLPNCRLQTLERHICNRIRFGDIPGSQIPEVYHEYVRSSNARLMGDILKHNLLDLVTMADLMTRFPTP